ncbi:MAG TPA: hypothetical protein VGM42_15040, partial [Rhodopila sp.]
MIAVDGTAALPVQGAATPITDTIQCEGVIIFGCCMEGRREQRDGDNDEKSAELVEPSVCEGQPGIRTRL